MEIGIDFVSDDSYSIPAIEKVIENAARVNCEFCEKPGATVRTQVRRIMDEIILNI
jgi:hypothetical protein